ncbi:MAG: hypothetical protein QOH93_2173 [Chloroflexia bacterium]|jgi:hypothetical protein|nr:hypothetical protein [Chloroflexia bacterium]
MQTQTLPTQTKARPALVHLPDVLPAEPDPLHATQSDVARYVSRLQEADRALALQVASRSLSPAEAILLQRRRDSIHAGMARQATLAARRFGSDREGSIATLNAIFNLGTAPDPAMSGSYRGDLLSTTLFSPLDSFGRFMARIWLPWKGKRLDSATSTGYNYLTPGGRRVARIVWSLYKHATRTENGLYPYFTFKTSYAPAVDAAGVTTLNLDYNLPQNPAFLVRAVLDEVVQISGGYYLGKAYLRSRRGNYHLAAYFALRPDPIA